MPRINTAAHAGVNGKVMLRQPSIEPDLVTGLRFAGNDIRRGILIVLWFCDD